MKQLLQNILGVLSGREKRNFSVLLLLDILINIIDILSLAVLLWIIKLYVQPSGSPLPSFLPAWMSAQHAMGMVAVFLVLFAFKNIAAWYVNRANCRFASEVAIRLSEQNLRYYQQSPFSEFVHTDSSVHIRKISFQPFEFTQYMLSGLQQIITQSSLILIAITAIILFNATLFVLLLLILLPPVVLVFMLIKKRMGRIKDQIRSSNEHSFRYLLDALKGYVEGNIYGRNGFFEKRFVNTRRQFSHYLFDSQALQSLPGRIIEVFAILGLFLLIVIANWLGGNDHDLLITIGAFMAAAYKIIPGIVKLINNMGQMRAYELSMHELQAPALQEVERAKPEPIRSVGMQQVHFLYAGTPVVESFSWEAQTGDFIGITGYSGRGKTTLLNLLLGFLSPQSGEVVINGQPVSPQECRRYWPSIAYVRQQVFLINDSITKNITLEENISDASRFQKVLRASGLQEMIQQLPAGAETVITENGKNISGGQQQRIAIARALYANADLILLDEPFNELDERSMHALLAHCRELAQQGKIILLVTHDKESLAYCNKTISLDAGK